MNCWQIVGHVVPSVDGLLSLLTVDSGSGDADKHVAAAGSSQDPMGGAAGAYCDPTQLRMICPYNVYTIWTC